MSAGVFGAYRTCFAIEIWVACCFTAVCHLLRRFCIRIFLRGYLYACNKWFHFRYAMIRCRKRNYFCIEVFYVRIKEYND